MELGGKNVVYMGGCGGIGAATCKLLAQNGIANLAILDLNENVELLDELKGQSPSVNAFFLKVDISNRENVEKCLNEVISRIQHIDVLVNGSGIVDEGNPKHTIDVNLLGVIYSTLAALEHMDKSKGGQGGLILNIASIAGLEPLPQFLMYSTSKAGVVMFTRNLGDEFHSDRTGVSLVVVCPGVTDTKLIQQFKRDGECKYVSSVTKKMQVAKVQTAEACAKHIVIAIEENKSGAVYVSNDSKMMIIPMPRWNSPAKVSGK